MERRVKLLGLSLLAVLVAGCSGDAGPNDPQVSGKEIDQQREKMIDENDKGLFKAENGPGGPAGKGR